MKKCSRRSRFEPVRTGKVDEEDFSAILEMDEFASVREQISVLLTGIVSPDRMVMQHDEVEEWVEKESTEFARRLVQSHLDLRAQSEPVHVSVEGADGIRRESMRSRRRQLETVFGEVEVQRTGYGADGSASLFPVDRDLNLPKRKYSHRLQYRVVKEAAGHSYDTTVESIAETTGGRVPKLQAEQIVIDAMKDFESFNETHKAEEPELTGDLLIMTMDGKGIVMRREGLREATRKAAEGESHKYKTRLSKGEKRNRKRMATVASVYSVAPYERTAEMIMKQEEMPSATEPRARNKRVWASVERDMSTVADEMVREALRRDPERNRVWVLLLDGAEAQLRSVQTSLRKYGVADTILILDFIHVLEYLWKAAHCFHPEGSPEAEEWVKARGLEVLKGNASEVARGMRSSATKRGLTAARRKAVDVCADYLIKYKVMLRYDHYLKLGLPIATGVIEGACRHLIKDRLDITGARWSLPGAEAVLKARSLNASHDLLAYWAYHKSQEHKRNHLQFYAPAKAAA